MNIYEIAKIANLSVASVSKVINGKEGVSPQTRKLVHEIMEKVGYKPKISKSILDSVGVVFWDNGNNHPLSSPYLSKVLEGATDILIEHNLYVTLIPIERLPKNKYELKQFCQKRKIAGLIFLNLRESNRYLCDYSDLVPIVITGTEFGKSITSVRSKNREGAYEAVSYLISMGHKNICVFYPDYGMQDHNDRVAGYLQALKDNNIPIRQDLIIDYKNMWETDITLVLENLIFNKPEPPTAMFVYDDLQVLMITSILKKLNVKIPHDMSIVGFDDYDYSAHFSPPLTTVRQPLYDLGKISAHKLIERISDNTIPIENIMLDTKLIIRKSVIKQAKPTS